MTRYRLKQSGAIVTPRRDFFVVVPREYRAAGCPPASQFIDDLMRHMGRRYSVGLLTAAALHGAGHLQTMAFQVMVDSAELPMSSVFDGAATQPMQRERCENSVRAIRGEGEDLGGRVHSARSACQRAGISSSVRRRPRAMRTRRSTSPHP